MLTALQKFAKSPFAWGLFALLILSFLVFGIGDVFNQQLGRNVVTAGDRKVTPAQFVQNFERVLKQLGEQEQRPVSRDEAIGAGIHDQLLESMATRESLGEATERLNVRPSAALIAKELEQIPAFFSQLTGKFDKEAYRAGVNQFGYSIPEFERIIGDELAGNSMMAGIQAGFTPPRTYGALVAINQFENRSLDYVFLDARKAAPPPEPTEAELVAFMNEPNVASRLRKPETRDLTVVRFGASAAAAAKIDEEELKKLYDFRLPSISQPELRSFIQIPAKDAAAAKAASDRLAKGEDPTAIAKSLGVDAIVYDQKPKTAVPDAKVRDAAFSLNEGQVSGPIQGSLGYAAIKVTQVTPGRSPTLEEIRPQLELELRKDLAQKAVFDAAERFQKAQESGADFAAAARAAGVTPVTIPGVTASEGAPRPPQAPPARAGLTPKLVQRALGLSPGTESDIEPDDNGDYFVVRVDKVTPPAMPALAEVRNMLTEAYMARQLQEQLRKQADAIAERVRKGETLQAAAAAQGVTVTRLENVSPGRAPPEAQLLGQEGMQTMFRSKVGEVFVAPATQPGFVVGKLQSVKAGDLNEMARAVAQAQQGVIAQQMTGDIQQLALNATRRILKARVDRERAHAALGIEPATPAPAAGAPKKKDNGG